MSQTQQQQQPKAEPVSRPRIARISFVNAISFAGTINAATSDPGLAAVSRQGAGINIVPVRLTAEGMRELRDGDRYDGFRLSKTEVDRSGPKPREVTRQTFVPRENVSEVAFNSEA